MKATFNRKSLLDTMAIASKAVPQRTPKPVLMSARLAVSQDGAVVEATNLDLSVRVRVACQGGGDAVVLLPAAKTVDVLKRFTGEDVTLEIQDRRVVFTSGNGKVNLPTENPDEFPSLPSPSEPTFKVVGNLLYDAISGVAFAAEQESTRYAIGSIRLECEGDTLNTVAMDGRVLCNRFITVEKHSDNAAALLAPECVPLLREFKAEFVTVSIDDSWVHFACPKMSVSSRQVEGRYPAWRKTIRDKSATEVDVTVEHLGEVVSQQAPVDSDIAGEPCASIFTFGETELVVTTRSSSGDAESSCPITLHGKQVELLINGRYLSDFLRTVPGDTPLSIGIETPMSAVILAAPGVRYVVMPVMKE